MITELLSKSMLEKPLKQSLVQIKDTRPVFLEI